MEAHLYQVLAARTLLSQPDSDYTPQQLMLVWNATGLAGEAGEVVDTIKKGVFHHHGINQDELIEELGDLMWYVAGICTTLEIELDTVMQINIAKLQARYPDGYSSERSINRDVPA